MAMRCCQLKKSETDLGRKVTIKETCVALSSKTYEGDQKQWEDQNILFFGHQITGLSGEKSNRTGVGQRQVLRLPCLGSLAFSLQAKGFRTQRMARQRNLEGSCIVNGPAIKNTLRL